MKSLICFLAITALISCNQNKQSEKNPIFEDKGGNPSIENSSMPPLTEGETELTDESFGNIIELTGKAQPVDRIFKISETEMLVKDSFLIIKNRNEDCLFMALSFPDFKYLKSFGKIGNGPDEFQYASLFKSNDKKSSCYVYDQNRNNLYSINKNFDLARMPVSLSKNQKHFGDKQFYPLTDSSFLYAESTKEGKAIFQMNIKQDTTTLIKKVYNLSFSSKHNNWASYIGDFGANPQKQRMVYAYKYFKRLVFIDTKSMKIKTLIFKKKQNLEAGNEIKALGPDNVTHYWGISAQKNYVYFLYSGRTPIEVSNGFRNHINYIYVEKFDWNGNPVCKYKLDRWGYFCVNEDENKIILASTTEDDPFYIYKIPSVNQ